MFDKSTETLSAVCTAAVPQTPIKSYALALTLAGLALAATAIPACAAPNSSYDALGGSILGSPVSVAWGPNRLDTFVVGTDHQLYHKAWDGSHWLPSATNYEALGGSIRGGSKPAVVSWGAGRLDIVVVGNDRRLYHKAWDGARWLPSITGFELLGGNIRDGSSPAISSWGSNRLDIFVVGADQALNHKAWDGNRWLPSTTDFEFLGGYIHDNTSPAVTSWGSNRLDIAIVSNDLKVYHKAWDGNSWQPSQTGYEFLGGSVRDGSSAAIVSRGSNRLDIFVVGDDMQLDHKAWESNKWLPSSLAFEPLGGVILDGTSPSAVVWDNNKVSVFVVGTDHAVYHKAYDGRGWWAYENLDGRTNASPVVTSWPGRMDVFETGTDNGLHHKARNSYEWLTTDRVGTVPVTGSTKWAVILCKTSDHHEEPQPPAYFRWFLTEAGNGLGGMYDYWRDMSYGAISLEGSQVKGWYTMPLTLAQLNALSRQDKVKACVSAANADFHDQTNFFAIAAMFNTPSVDSGYAGAAALNFNGVNKAYEVVSLASSVWTPTFTGHEMGHAYGLDHSWSRFPDIEYGDPYDIMSALIVTSYLAPLPLFGQSGPGLNGVYRESLGWIPASRIFSTNLTTPATLSLSSLDGSNPAGGYLMAKIFAFGRTDRYYTVELRQPTHWDRGFPRETVLIHEVLSDGHSYLLNDGGADHGVGQPFRDSVNNVSVVVLNMDSHQATIQIARLH